MAKSGLVINIRAAGIPQTLKALKDIGKHAEAEIRVAALDLAKEMATAVKAAGMAEGSQAALVSTTVKATRDRVPVVQAGGAKKLGSNRKPAFKLLFGSEFGSNAYKQFGKPHIGNGSYWFFKTVEEHAPEILDRWQEAADEIVRKYGEGG